MARRVLIVLPLVVACGVQGSPRAPRATTTVHRVTTAPPPAPEADAASPCGDIPPSRKTLPEAATSEVCPRHAAQGAVETELRKSFYHAHLGSKLEVGFRCDGLTGPIEQIMFSRGWGHGFSLELYTLTRGGDRFSIRGVRYAGDAPVEILESTAPAASVDDALAHVRAALGATLQEIEPKLPPGQLSLGGFSTSSNDFHVGIRLRTKTHQRGWRFTGYDGSAHQEVHLPLKIARDRLTPLIDNLEPRARPLTDADRAVFADHFLWERPHFDDDFNWWVKERYVTMARTAGSRDLIPGLVSLLRTGDDRSTEDTTRDALAALAAITGWDARDPKQPAESSARAIADYRRACAAD